MSVAYKRGWLGGGHSEFWRLLAQSVGRDVADCVCFAIDDNYQPNDVAAALSAAVRLGGSRAVVAWILALPNDCTEKLRIERLQTWAKAHVGWEAA